MGGGIGGFLQVVATRWRPCPPLKHGSYLAAVPAMNSASTAPTKVLSQIQMDEVAPVNRVKQRAAQARWRAHNEAKARWAAGDLDG